MSFSWKNEKKQYLVLAPMANITTYPFRSVVKEMGADVVFTPMISSNAILYNPEKTIKIAHFKKYEKPIIVQLFGYDGDIIAKAAKAIEKELKPDGIDLNMGCPAPKITGNECGSALLKNYPKGLDLAKKVRGKYSGELSVKLRLGWDKADIGEFIKNLERIGINGVTIHGRTAKEGYRGKADWEEINKIVLSTKMPVIGNGDIASQTEAAARLKNKNLQGIMIGRAALGNPWLFKSIKEKKEIKPKREELIEIIIKHTERACEYLGEEKAVREMRKHLCWYLKGFQGAQDLRKRAVKVERKEDIIELTKMLASY